MDINQVLTMVSSGESERIEFKRKAPGDIHRHIAAMANADGGFILFGVDDGGNVVGTDPKRDMERIAQGVQCLMPAPKISSHRFRIDGKTVLIISVQKSHSLISDGGLVHIRIGAGIRPLSVQEILSVSCEMGTVEWDRSPLRPVKDLKKEYADWFFEKLEEARKKRIPGGDRLRYLRSAGAVHKDRLTNAGVLFFTDAGSFLPQAGLRLVRLEGEKPVSSKEYDGPVWRMIDDVYSDIIREIGSGDAIVGVARRKVVQYPVAAIREAVINAVAHRNYAIHADIRIFLADSGLTVRSPGGLLPGVDLADPEHVPRNPTLCNLLHDCGYIERYGRGLLMMREAVSRHPGLRLELGTTGYRFDAGIKRDLGYFLERQDRDILALLSESRRSGELSRMAGMSKVAVLKRLRKLEGMGLVRTEGAGPQRRYRASGSGTR